LRPAKAGAPAKDAKAEWFRVMAAKPAGEEGRALYRLRRHPAPPGNGRNRQEEERKMADIGGIAADRLRTFVERIERLEEEKAAITADIREVYSEAKGTGFNAKILRQIVRLRGLDQADRREQEAMLELYKRALDL
jgi:uncharacterized protein (UPF0335 family)